MCYQGGKNKTIAIVVMPRIRLRGIVLVTPLEYICVVHMKYEEVMFLNSSKMVRKEK